MTAHVVHVLGLAESARGETLDTNPRNYYLNADHVVGVSVSNMGNTVVSLDTGVTIILDGESWGADGLAEALCVAEPHGSYWTVDDYQKWVIQQATQRSWS